MKIKAFYDGNSERPEYKSSGAAGVDLRNEGESFTLQPGESKFFGTGFYTEIPKGYFGLVVVRSSIGIKLGGNLINSVGIIDSDYRGEHKAKLVNLGTEPFTIENGERVAQILFLPVVQAELEYVDTLEELEESDRGAGGYGSTGRH